MTAEPQESRQNAAVRASVIIPTRGGRERLHYPLDGLRRQDIEDFEVIVVVDGDIDATEELLRARREDGFQQLRWIVFPENRGRSAALNAGASAARGEVLIRCDDDLAPEPDFVRVHLDAHPDPARPSACVGLTRNIYPDSAYARVYGRPSTRDHVAAALASPPETHWRHWAANCSLNRAAERLVGGYDADYRRYGWEDVDLGYRLHDAGVPVRIEPRLTTDHLGPALSAHSRTLRALHAGAARELFVRKHGPEALGPDPAPGGLWGLLVKGASHLLTERTVRFISRGTDHILPVVPEYVGRKMVALLVEGASLSGIRHPRRARSSF